MSTMKKTCHTIFDLLRELKALGVYYELRSYSVDRLMVLLTIPGVRIEIDCVGDERFEVAIFRGEEISEISLPTLLQMHKESDHF